MMRFFAEDLLSAILEAAPRPTVEAPRDARGLYGLVDHHGDLRYIGSTSSAAETLYKRLHRRHRTGSENTSHYFSMMYNTGRMWRYRRDALTKGDGDVAKALRNEFVVDHCRAVWLPLPDTVDIARLEAEVLSLAPDYAIAWNRRRMQAYEEPVELVETTLRRLGWGARELAAIERQRLRFRSAMVGPVMASAPKIPAIRQTRVTPFPKGPFRFFALDVETANNDRGSICQIGVACVRPDNSIETWVTYVDPQVDRWVFTNLHGISARTVQGAPTFAEVLPVLRDALNGATVYQHSGFVAAPSPLRVATAAGLSRSGTGVTASTLPAPPGRSFVAMVDTVSQDSSSIWASCSSTMTQARMPVRQRKWSYAPTAFRAFARILRFRRAAWRFRTTRIST
jgi:DNA polymerase III subunit epsilon